MYEHATFSRTGDDWDDHATVGFAERLQIKLQGDQAVVFIAVILNCGQFSILHFRIHIANGPDVIFSSIDDNVDPVVVRTHANGCNRIHHVVFVSEDNKSLVDVNAVACLNFQTLLLFVCPS